MKNLLAFLIFCSCGAFAQSKTEVDLSAIKKAMGDQQEAWNKADLETFMEGYWKSDSLRFIGHRGITYGWQSALTNYKKIYPSPEAMGKLTFTILYLEKLSNETAFMIGKYQLNRKADQPSGYFTLLWRKMGGKWVIVADHTS